MKAFCQQRTRERAKRQALSQLACVGRHTITGLACTAGRQFVDWSGDYRLHSRDRWEVQKIFEPIMGGILELLPSDMPFVVGMDDTLVHKTGRKIRGVGYGRDPLSPPFHVNLILRQRFLQISGMLAAQGVPGPARAVKLAPAAGTCTPSVRGDVTVTRDQIRREAARQGARPGTARTGQGTPLTPALPAAGRA